MPLPMLRQLTLASLITLGLTACGGSDSGPNPPAASSSAGQPSSSVASSSSVGQSSSAAVSSSSAPADVEPAEFSFEPQTDVERGATVTSNAITVSEIDAATTIGIAGGAYAVNGGDYTQGEGTVESGDSVTVQLTAPEGFATEASATLTIGGVSGTFTVTTEERDTTPDTFSFAPQTDIEVGAKKVVSNSVTITGINSSLPVRVTGGEYQINDQAFTSAEGQLVGGDQLTLRGNAPEAPESTHEVVVYVGETAGTFAITTVADVEPPTVEVIFPTPTTATEGDAIAIRGVANDEISSVRSVTLSVSQGDGASATESVANTDNGFEQWTAEVSLSSGENIISITAEDEHGNVTEEAVRLSVTRQPFVEAFPADQEFDVLDGSFDVVVDEKRAAVYVANGSGRNIVSIDLKTATPSVLLDTVGEALLGIPRALALSETNDRLLVGTELLGNTEHRDSLVGYDLENDVAEVISSNIFPSEEEPSLYVISATVFNPKNPNEAFIVDGSSRTIISRVDLEAGHRAYVSSDEEPGDSLGTVMSMLVDGPNNALLVPRPAGIYSVSLETGERTPFMVENSPEGTPQLWIFAMATDDIKERIFISNFYSKEIWDIDVRTKTYSVVSGSEIRENTNPLGVMRGMAVAKNGQLLFGLDSESTAVWVVDSQTGERVILAKPEGDLPN
ncbi:hypothetical protein [Marinimicrobium agarilyticum]|uniref:hypothetical protein n=1 Tax=Marinimicrobium agarilyticum TaxID=306546 RepID=UPI000411F515|nr:hypothetical protein [Marinimicrobium agarilyticum]